MTAIPTDRGALRGGGAPPPQEPNAVLVVVLCAAALSGLGHLLWTEVLAPGTTRASDALPLYLSAAAVADGADPTRQAALEAAYDARGLRVGAATFSTLYPATAGALLRPFAALDWEAFTQAWRSLLVLAVASYAASVYALAAGPGGSDGPPTRRARLAWAAVLVAVLAWHPVTAETVRLGQVNLLLGALCAGSMALLLHARDGSAGTLLALGALLKLVPGAGILPILAARRARPAVALAGVGLAGVALALRNTALPRILEAVGETLRFQSAIDPDWLVGADPVPGWMRLLGYARHDGLQWITLGAIALVPLLRPSARTACGGVALLCAWLGADAAGFHVLYAPLAYPALAWAGVGRPGRFALLAGALWALAQMPADLGAEPRMVLWGLLAWGMAAERLLRDAAEVAPGPLEADPSYNAGALSLAGVACGVSLALSVPGAGPAGPPLPEGRTAPEGPGFITPSDRVPGSVAALGDGPDRAASTLARPGTIRALQLWMRRAPLAWEALAERYPARSGLLRERARAAPAGELRDHSGRAIGAWLRDERAAAEALAAEGLDVSTVRAGLDPALESGLADLPSSRR